MPAKKRQHTSRFIDAISALTVWHGFYQRFCCCFCFCCGLFRSLAVFEAVFLSALFRIQTDTVPLM